MSSGNSVHVEIEGRIARVEVRNARKLNTLNRALMTDFAAAMEELSRNASVDVAILRGEGERAFIGGADIGEMADLDPESARDFITLVHRCCRAVRYVHVPVIARCVGYTLGAGLEIAASCDLRIASQTAKFGMPEVKLGIPSVVEAAIIPKLIGWGRARRMLLLGETLGAKEIESWGLVDKVVADAQLDTSIEEWADQIVQIGRAARLQKRLMRQWEDLALSEAIEAGVEAFAEAYESTEPRSKMLDFVSRRRGLLGNQT